MEGNFDRPVVNGHHSKQPSHHSVWKTPLGAHFAKLGSNLTPYHILDPMAAFLMTSNSPCSLHTSLDLFRKALEKLAISQSEDIISTLIPSDGNPILRLEMELSHVVDPLAWLHAQQQRQQTAAIPQVYLKTESLEAAAFGAAFRHTHSSSSSKSERLSLWRLVQEQLPSKSLLYGGERFDTNTTAARMGEEWKRFGQAMWILPAIELRFEQIQPPSPHTDSLSTMNARNHPSTITLAVHLHRLDDEKSWSPAAARTLALLQKVSSRVSDQVPTTTLPPVLSRESSYYDKDGNGWDGQELYEKGVMAALEEFERKSLEKVVLARRMDLNFGAHVSALDILKRWKYGGQEGGHLFYLHPGRMDNEDDDDDSDIVPGAEFFGCTPERLFQIQPHSNLVISEALAGTRPRGTTQQADEDLSRDLCASSKDVEENMITGRYIQRAFSQLCELGWIIYQSDGREGLNQLDQEECVLDKDSRFFVRRLRHLQHICQRFEGAIQQVANGVDVARFLMERLHPTPAVAGYPSNGALDFIREHESIGFDRGYYSGPFGYIGSKSADILVAIRSGLVSPSHGGMESKVSLYAGAGIVPGSTVHGEWAETSYKLEVVSSLFPQSPITLQSAPTPNVAWATAFLEELIRQGVTQFYVCPGSRSTPLVVALAKAVRSNVGVVRAISVHDERGAGFRAVGYARGANRPAAVITSSGTATANLYPSIMEAGVDGVPLLILTADRPYENRDTGANQSVDQVKAYSSSFIRWFRDILPPSDDVPVSVALSDAGHAVKLAKKLRGPVHLNIQFRENLAPDGGLIRNDNRADSTLKFDGFRFIDCPGFQRWSTKGDRWMKDLYADSGNEAALYDVARLISQSSRGIIVVGNVRLPTNERGHEETSHTMQAISSFAQFVGFPVIAGVQAAGLRFTSDAVIPFAEHLLKHSLVAESLKPDLILQVGAPLVSSDVASMITTSMKNGDAHVQHILLHPHHPNERVDPGFTVSLGVSTEISPFLQGLVEVLEKDEFKHFVRSSELSPLVLLGRKLRDEMEQIIHQSSRAITFQQAGGERLTEPQVVLALSQSLTKQNVDLSLFLSNSMPVRDAESFLYPFVSTRNQKLVWNQVGVNRGASGIDGIISAAAGFAEATQRPTTLLIGDLAALHDLNALHTVSRTSPSQVPGSPLTTVVVNNDGGGIFSFLPIAKHGSDVSFEEYFGTATNSFSFGKGVEAFGLPFKQVTTFASFRDTYRQAVTFEQPSVVEAVVASRDINVAVHREITKRVVDVINLILGDEARVGTETKLPIKIYSRESFDAEPPEASKPLKTLVTLHGWMGEKTDWDDVGTRLAYTLPPEWTIISVDLPGHGCAPDIRSSDTQVIRSALGLGETGYNPDLDRSLSVDEIASFVLESLSRDYGVKSIDAIAGYSLGGRVALAMKRLSLQKRKDLSLIHESTKMILISANPGKVEQVDTIKEDARRVRNDERLAAYIEAVSNRGDLLEAGGFSQMVIWSDFLRKWYNAPIWGNLPNVLTLEYQNTITKRWKMLVTKGRDVGAAMRDCSPPRQSRIDWKGASNELTLFIAGELDAKYSHLGRVWSSMPGSIRYVEIPKAGHGLLVDASAQVAEIMTAFLGDSNLPAKGFQRSAIDVRIGPSSERLSASPTLELGSVEPNPMPSLLFQNGISQIARRGEVCLLEFKPFSIPMGDASRNEPSVFGVGWGEKAQAIPSLEIDSRSGFVLHLLSRDGALVGIGEVSPLPGLHNESLKQAEEQLILIQSRLRNQNETLVLYFEAGSILRLNGGMADFISELSFAVGLRNILPSVRAGIEMAVVSMAAQVVGTPVHQAILDYSDNGSISLSLPLNGIITRAQASVSTLRPKWLPQMNGMEVRKFRSVKAKVGHQDTRLDVEAVLGALSLSGDVGAIRVDANRAWSAKKAIDFATSVEGIDFALERLEFVEEPLIKQDPQGREWSLEQQVEALEKWYDQTGIPYALDESLAELAEQVAHDFDKFEKELMNVFKSGRRGCAAFVLKPSLLGLEFSMRLSRLGSNALGIPSVMSSSFDSGVGLSFAGFLGAASDAVAAGKRLKTFPHGLGTFSNLAEDTISPPFDSYVDSNGVLNVASLGRALYGLSLDEIRSFVTSNGPMSEQMRLPTSLPQPLQVSSVERQVPGGADYEATMSSNGRETNVVASLPLPFSADIASSRFTDLPQQPRWSPWLSCVAYLDAPGRETEWTLNVRGAKFSWRAISRLLETPNKGIMWEAVSGLQHRGVVEFVPSSTNSCLMRVRMTIIVPRIIATLFQGASVFLEDFLQSKLLKWSMEMFRDVVKGDLALERGDVELGDALFGAVEGKASAIEATLSPTTTTTTDGDGENR
jgi:2-succinyl-5-enolpyruvyl-6-hydroxy-3-cyclohexene-1-carboxylate synthase